MLSLIHTPELDALYSEICRLQARLGFRGLLDESAAESTCASDLRQKIDQVRRLGGCTADASDRDIADLIWRECAKRVEGEI